jgi:uncharacterized protein
VTGRAGVPLVVDAWAQPLTDQLLDRVPEAAPVFRRSGWEANEHVRGPEALVAEMDAAGVDVLMLCAWCRPDGWVVTNDDVAAYVRAFPTRFAGVAAVPLERPVEAARELERAVAELGFKALRVVPWIWRRPPSDPLFYPLYLKCVELGTRFCTQVGHTGPLMPSETGRPIPYLDQVALDFPELTIVGGHIGHPWTDEMIGVAWKHENVYIDTSAYAPRYYPSQLLNFANTYGRAKVLFGTNWPQLPLRRCTAEAAELPLDPEARTAFMGANAARVFGLP